MIKCLFLFIPLLFFCQKTAEIPTLGSLRDNSNTFSKITVLDQREDKNIGTVNFKNKEYQFVFKNNDVEKYLTEWFNKSNTTNGASEVVVLLEELKIVNEPVDEKNNFAVKFKASSFLEKNGDYLFLNRINSITGPGEYPQNIPGISFRVSDLFKFLLKNSYTASPSNIVLTKEDLKSYDLKITADLPAIKASSLADGLYKTSESFFSQTPSQGYEIIRNNSGEVTKFKSSRETLPSFKIFAFVENGKAQLYTAGGFFDLEKDDNGFYITTNEATLFPAQMNPTYGMFGLIGAGIGAIDTHAKNKKAQKGDTYKIYIDALTGKYILGK